MRKCMKNFNFKLDYNEIDRIIEEGEENDGGPAEQISREESKVMVEEPLENKVDI